MCRLTNNAVVWNYFSFVMTSGSQRWIMIWKSMSKNTIFLTRLQLEALLPTSTQVNTSFLFLSSLLLTMISYSRQCHIIIHVFQFCREEIHTMVVDAKHFAKSMSLSLLIFWWIWITLWLTGKQMKFKSKKHDISLRNLWYSLRYR